MRLEGPITLVSVLKRDRLLVGAGLAGVAALGWAHILYLVSSMAAMDVALRDRA